ncbi:hypothetical protein BDP27DRAFT_1417295 [Rhodocollybia butyracea]|uniref:Lipoprotein n=1 Tax=Rhodocollybia butyracea TaxID=206335 RepID=A0A9P5Q2X4_9AGAR|nr:hypothetical protein BDP27DRAFT_1417295 [Rhodocollybia butyracea]
MLLPHRWLGFALLAVLISFACAAPASPPPPPPPTQISYMVKVFNEDGTKATTVPYTHPSVEVRIQNLLSELGKDLGGGKPFTRDYDFTVDRHTTGKTTDMVYFELQGGPETQKSYGYVVSVNSVAEGKTPRLMQVGAIVTRHSVGSFTVVDYIPRGYTLSNIAKGHHRDAFDKFLEFELVKEWAKELKAEGPGVKMSEQLRRPEPAPEPEKPKPKRKRKRKHGDTGPAAKRLSASAPRRPPQEEGATNDAPRPLPAQGASSSHTSEHPPEPPKRKEYPDIFNPY